MNNINLNNFFLKPLNISLLIIIVKWAISYYYFLGSIDFKIIYEISDNHYFPLIKSFSELKFNPAYSKDVNDLKLISFPILGLLSNTIFYKIFGLYSFIILEIFCVYLFLLIFTKIFIELEFSYLSSLIFAIILLTLPQLLIDLSKYEIGILNKISINFQTFYSLRVPRPLVSNIFLFGFLYFILKFYLSKENNYKYISISMMLMCLTMHTFFYFFLFQLFLLISIYLAKFKKEIFNFIIKNVKLHVKLLLLLIFFYSLFIIQSLYDESDYALRMGLIELDEKQSLILQNYFINFFLKPEFIFIFLFNTIIFFINKKVSLNFFYYLFISTLFSTIFFIVFFKKGIDYYHFTNWILTTGLLFPLIFLFDILKKFINKLSSVFVSISIISLIFYYSVSLNKNNLFLSQYDSNKKKDLVELTNYLKSNDKKIPKDIKLLTFDFDASIYLIMKGYDNLNLVPVSFWTPKTTSEIEKDLILSFKFLNLSKDDFLNFFENKKGSLRYKNKFTERFFDRVYLANQLKTFNNEMDYSKSEIEFINNNNPLITHQLIIPKSEFQRLSNKFDKINEKINPGLVIIADNNEILNKSTVNSNLYCVVLENESYILYINKIMDDLCN
jgi:hypothetical protein